MSRKRPSQAFVALCSLWLQAAVDFLQMLNAFASEDSPLLWGKLKPEEERRDMESNQ